MCLGKPRINQRVIIPNRMSFWINKIVGKTFLMGFFSPFTVSSEITDSPSVEFNPPREEFFLSCSKHCELGPVFITPQAPSSPFQANPGRLPNGRRGVSSPQLLLGDEFWVGLPRGVFIQGERSVYSSFSEIWIGIQDWHWMLVDAKTYLHPLIRTRLLAEIMCIDRYVAMGKQDVLAHRKWEGMHSMLRTSVSRLHKFCTKGRRAL